MATIAPPDPALLRRLIVELERWGRERSWSGPDPYEAMNSPLLSSLCRTPLARRIGIQVVKRSPLDLRRPLAIRPRHNSATISHLLSAYTRLEPIPEVPRGEAIAWALERLNELRRPEYELPCWGYPFDVETRFFFYSASTPNTVATAFAGYALLDAYDSEGDSQLLDRAMAVGEFFLEEIPLTDAEGGAYFGYFPGDRTPIHNASLLAGGLLAELHRHGGPERFAEAARQTAGFAIAHQRTDGSWPYAETPIGDWVDNFHTGYVLDALGRIEHGLGHPGVAEARRRGLDHYAADLFEPDGAPRFFDHSLYPIDGQCMAQAIATFSAAAEQDAAWLDAAWRVLHWGARSMRRRDGAFLFQRRRHWVNPTPHVRWVEAPMLEALARLATAESARAASEAEPSRADRGRPREGPR